MTSRQKDSPEDGPGSTGHRRVPRWLASAFVVVMIAGSAGPVGAQRGAARPPVPPPPGGQPIHYGASNETIQIKGVTRKFIRYVPRSYDGSKPVPLVVAMHGRGGTAAGFERDTGFNAKADAANFIVLYPSALGNPTAWNSGLEPANTADDVDFIPAMIDQVESHFQIDRKRVFSAGFSSGAVMSYFLAGQFADRFAAVGIASGTAGAKMADGTIKMDPAPSRPVPIIAFHGKKDTHIQYNGGALHYDAVSVADSIRFWTNADGCTGAAATTTKQNGNLIVDDYTHCNGGAEVILHTFVNGTHEWPSLSNNDNFNATDAVWKFFVAHPKP
jgi:polyhydroxybutyrate depolymerase